MFKSVSLLLALLYSFHSFAGPMVSIETSDELNAYIAKSSFNGVVLVAKDNTILFKKAFGVKDFDSKTPLSVNDKFQIGSNTKQFVAASLLKLQEEGKISLDDEVTKYLPEYPLLKNIKIMDVLDHTSGIANYTDQKKFWDMVDYDKTLSLDNLIEFAISFPFDFEPRTNWNYSNSNYIVAGKILETVSGEQWDQYIQNHFILPINMTSTGYNEYFDKVSDVTGYVTKDGVLSSVKFNLSWALSAGALYSNVDDLLKWTSIYDKSNLLSEESKKEMQTPFMKNYGLGLMISAENGDTMLFHNGRTPGFNSSIAYLKNSKLAVITLDNVDGRFPVANVVREYYSQGKSTAIKYDSYPVTEEELQNYVGDYGGSAGLQLKIFLQNGKLFLQPNDGQPPYQMRANDKDSFDLQGFAGEEFLRDQNGIVVSLKHYQNGHENIFPKKN
jgi:CubicO group peptidase (beta-lactamase class C family)